MSSNIDKIYDKKDIQNTVFETDLINNDDLIKDLRTEQKKDKRANLLISLSLLFCLGTVLFLFNYF